jgi:hypothetical protein
MSICNPCTKAKTIFKCLDNVILTNLTPSTVYRVRLESLSTGYNLMIPITASVSGDVATTDVQLPVNHTIRMTVYDSEGCEVLFPLYDCTTDDWIGENDCTEFRIINRNIEIESQRLSV